MAEETLKIIIALISIIFLIYFLSSLYFNNKNSQDLELAEASLEHLINEINNEVESVDIYNPEGWVIFSFPLEDGEIPNSCSNLGWKSCMCTGKEVSEVGKILSLAPFTQTLKERRLYEANNGYCLESDYKINGNLLKIENPPITLQINHESKKIN